MKFLSDKEQDIIVEVIRKAEKNSTGEIRVHISSSQEKNNAEQAYQIFCKYCKGQTKHKNAILIHINFTQRYLTIIGDEGIHQRVKQDFWNEIHDRMTILFASEQYLKGITEGVESVGIELAKYFPISGEKQLNELPDEILFS